MLLIHRGKTEVTEAACEGSMWDLLDKDFKEAMINTFRELKKTMLKEVEEDIAISHEIETISKEI